MTDRALRYFEIHDNVYVEGRWYLVDPVDGVGNALRGVFCRGKRVSVIQPVLLSHSRFAKRGNPMDYTEISADVAPVVHSRIAEVFRLLAPEEVELIPARVRGFSDEFYILNVLAIRNCIDESASRDVAKYTEEDRDVFPDRIGEYASVSNMKIHKEQVAGAKMFRTWGWSALVVTEDIKTALERTNTTGVRFEEV